jgi:hypothetical protein
VLLPGKAIRSRLRVPLPLRSAHPGAETGRIPALQHDATHAILEIDYFVDPDYYGFPARRILRGARARLPRTARVARVDEPDLEWSLEVVGDRLRIDYTVRNDTRAPIYLDDTIGTDAGAVIRLDSEIPETVALIRGFTKVRNVISEHNPRPARRRLARGGVATGTAWAPLPLEAWHNAVSRSDFLEISADATRAVLEIAYSADPTTIPGRDRILRGRVKPLPAGVAIASK